MCQACNPKFMAFLGAYGHRRAALRAGSSLLFSGLAGLGPAAARDKPRLVNTKTAGQAADTIFLARRIHTMASDQPRAQAVAVRDGRILAVGSKAAVMALKASATRVVDFGDLTVLPGFVDPHMHSNFCGLRPWLDVGPFTTNDMTQALGKIAAAAAAAKAGDWVMGKMLDPSLMPGQPLSRQALDRVAPKVPVFVLESNGHVAYVNSRAIELARITRDTPDPAQARFGRDAQGELSGRLEEPPAFQPFIAVLPKPSGEEFAGFLRADLDDAVARGCTSLHDCGIGGLYAEGDIALIDSVMNTDPGVRYAGMLVSTHMKKWREMGLRPGARSARFTLNGIKAWSDGSNQGGTGYQRTPYLGSSNRGALNYTPDEIEHVVREAHADGWQLGLHANGDAAIDVTLDALERGTAGQGGHKLRHRIEHCSILHDAQIARMKRLGISPSFLIGHVHFWGRAFRDRLLGPARANRLDPCRSALRGGLRISLHSDYNVTPIDPLRCVQNAVLRDMRDGGEILNPDERISALQGLRAVTIDAAWQCHLDDVCGSLEAGKAADMVVLERDPLTVAPDQIQAIKVHSTWLDGRQRFNA
jgi:predicted amidohydrolase YtcJ